MFTSILNSTLEHLPVMLAVSMSCEMDWEEIEVFQICHSCTDFGLLPDEIFVRWSYSRPSMGTVERISYKMRPSRQVPPYSLAGLSLKHGRMSVKLLEEYAEETGLESRRHVLLWLLFFSMDRCLLLATTERYERILPMMVVRPVFQGP